MVQKIVGISILLCAFISCQRIDYDGDTNIVSISSLRNVDTYNRSELISDNITIKGTVTANSMHGELYNSFIVEDNTAAIRIMCEFDNIYEHYPVNNIVTVHCSGLYLASAYGELALGAKPTGDYTLDYISQSALGQYVKRCEIPDMPQMPLQVDLCDLTPLHILRRVELHGVTITNPDGVSTFCQRDPITGRTVNTYHTVTDVNGDTAELAVSRNCSYADCELPVGPVNICAIVRYYNRRYSLTIVNAKYWQ